MVRGHHAESALHIVRAALVGARADRCSEQELRPGPISTSGTRRTSHDLTVAVVGTLAPVTEIGDDIFTGLDGVMHPPKATIDKMCALFSSKVIHLALGTTHDLKASTGQSTISRRNFIARFLKNP